MSQLPSLTLLTILPVSWEEVFWPAPRTAPLLLLPSSAELCCSNRIESGKLRGPISELACVRACFLIEFCFIFFVFVLSFLILIFVKVGVFCSFSGVFFIFVALLRNFCSILTPGHGHEPALEWLDVSIWSRLGAR